MSLFTRRTNGALAFVTSLDRVTKVTHGDGKVERVEWVHLHVSKYFDAEGKATIYGVNASRDVTSVTTPDGKTVQYVQGNCCGSIDTLVDAASPPNRTHWKYDVLDG